MNAPDHLRNHNMNDDSNANTSLGDLHNTNEDGQNLNSSPSRRGNKFSKAVTGAVERFTMSYNNGRSDPNIAADLNDSGIDASTKSLAISKKGKKRRR